MSGNDYYSEQILDTDYQIDGNRAHGPSVVLDIGSRWIRAGFAGQLQPQCILPAQSQNVHKARSSVQNLGQRLEGDLGALWSASELDFGQLEDLLEWHLRKIFTSHLPVDLSSRKVVISDRLFLPITIKYIMCRVLFTYFQVPSITFLCSEVAALMASGSGAQTGIVVDIGWHETSIVPVIHMQPLPFSSFNTERASRQMFEAYQALIGPSVPIVAIDAYLHEAEFCNAADTPAADVMIDNIHCIPGSQRGRAPTDVFFPTHGTHADYDEIGLATYILKAVERCPRDDRQALLANIVVVGAAANIPGLQSRLEHEVESKYPRHTSPSSIHVTSKIRDGMTASWRGASCLMDIIALAPMHHITRDKFNSGVGIADWLRPGYKIK